jgi:hypothetical protein
VETRTIDIAKTMSTKKKKKKKQKSERELAAGDEQRLKWQKTAEQADPKERPIDETPKQKEKKEVEVPETLKIPIPKILETELQEQTCVFCFSAQHKLAECPESKMEEAKDSDLWKMWKQSHKEPETWKLAKKMLEPVEKLVKEKPVKRSTTEKEEIGDLCEQCKERRKGVRSITEATPSGESMATTQSNRGLRKILDGSDKKNQSIRAAIIQCTKEVDRIFDKTKAMMNQTPGSFEEQRATLETFLETIQEKEHFLRGKIANLKVPEEEVKSIVNFGVKNLGSLEQLLNERAGHARARAIAGIHVKAIEAQIPSNKQRLEVLIEIQHKIGMSKRARSMLDVMKNKQESEGWRDSWEEVLEQILTKLGLKDNERKEVLEGQKEEKLVMELLQERLNELSDEQILESGIWTMFDVEASQFQWYVTVEQKAEWWPKLMEWIQRHKAGLWKSLQEPLQGRCPTNAQNKPIPPDQYILEANKGDWADIERAWILAKSLPKPQKVLQATTTRLSQTRVQRRQEAPTEEEGEVWTWEREDPEFMAALRKLFRHDEDLKKSPDDSANAIALRDTAYYHTLGEYFEKHPEHEERREKESCSLCKAIADLQEQNGSKDKRRKVRPHAQLHQSNRSEVDRVTLKWTRTHTSQINVWRRQLYLPDLLHSRVEARQVFSQEKSQERRKEPRKPQRPRKPKPQPSRDQRRPPERKRQQARPPGGPTASL